MNRKHFLLIGPPRPTPMDRPSLPGVNVLHVRGGRTSFTARMEGQSITEFVIVIPILLLLLFGTLQFAFIYIAKSTLNQAAFTGARLGAVNNASLCSIRHGVVKGLAPLFQSGGDQTNLAGYATARTTAWIKTMEGTFGGLNNVKIDVLNPSKASFSDFQKTVDGHKAIPNSRLLYRNTAVGSSSRQTIQDANLLKIRVHFCYPLVVPTISRMLGKLHQGDGGFSGMCYGAGGAPLTANATILMQSPARKSSTVEKLGLCSPF